MKTSGNNEQPKCSQIGLWINELWYVHQMEYKNTSSPSLGLAQWIVCPPAD